MRKTTRAILQTLAYADIFDYPLTKSELWKFLIGKPSQYAHFGISLAELEKEKQILQLASWYALRSRGQVVKLRQDRERAAKKKNRYAQKAARLLSHIPTVWFVGVSGALAMHNAPAEDDIDLFIITAPQTLWISRLLCVLALDIAQMRRKPDQLVVTNKICLNMFIDSVKLAVPQQERDLYSAHELTQLVPLYSKFNTYENFLSANTWVRKYLPHSFVPVYKRYALTTPMPLLRFLNLIAKEIQLKYMRRRRTREVVGSSMLRFHPVDARDWVREKYNLRLKALRIRPEPGSFRKQ